MSTDANARGARPTLGHIRGLDGIRAFAVLSIIAFHTGLNSVPGGFYGVDAFFVLSGFLITSLLVKEWGGTGNIRLRRFWAGRARRLLPALFLMVAVIGIVMALWPHVLNTPSIVGDAVSTVFYYSNWYSIHSGVTYFNLSAQPSPFLHTWSLAIEEQFYLVWPLVVLAVLKFRPRAVSQLWTGQRGRRAAARAEGAATRAASGRRFTVLGGGDLVVAPAPAGAGDVEWTRRRRLQLLFAVACLGSLASAVVMALLAPNGYTTRAYYGTDCRAQALLVGAAISIGLTLWHEGAQKPWFTTLAGSLGIAGVIGTGALWMTTSETTSFAFSGGFMVASLAAGGVVLGCVAAPKSIVVRFLELPPFPQWGRISYGVYLWYWPVLLILTGQRLHWGVYPLFLARVGITVAIAALSYDLVEMPIRRGALKHWRSWVAAPVGAAAAISAVFVSTLVPVGATELQGSPISLPLPTTTVVHTSAPGTGSGSSGSGSTGSGSGSRSGSGSTGSTGTGSSGTGSSGTEPRTTPSTTEGSKYLSPSLPALTGSSGHTIKVLLVGDSIAGTLGVGLAQYASAEGYKVQFADEGLPGCSAALQSTIKALWYVLPPGAPCSEHNSNAIFNSWRKWVNAYNPDVVLYVARGETFNQDLGGRWQNLGQTSYDTYVENRYREAVDILGARGASVVLMTSPYYDSSLSAGGPWPEDSLSRVQEDDSIIRQVATSSQTAPGGGKVYVYDLNSLVDPGNKLDESIGQVNIRCADGVHFSSSGGEYVGIRLMPVIAALGQSHATASPGGAWPGTLPPPTPSWYAGLPCQ